MPLKSNSHPMWFKHIYRKCIFSNDGENENGSVLLKNRVEKWTVNLVIGIEDYRFSDKNSDCAFLGLNQNFSYIQ